MFMNRLLSANAQMQFSWKPPFNDEDYNPCLELQLY